MNPAQQEAMAKAKDLLGEHFDGYVLSVEVDHADGEQQTFTYWRGKYNQALGIAHRTLKRISNEGADDPCPPPPEDGDEWKAAV